MANLGVCSLYNQHEPTRWEKIKREDISFLCLVIVDCWFFELQFRKSQMNFLLFNKLSQKHWEGFKTQWLCNELIYWLRNFDFRGINYLQSKNLSFLFLVWSSIAIVTFSSLLRTTPSHVFLKRIPMTWGDPPYGQMKTDHMSVVISTQTQREQTSQFRTSPVEGVCPQEDHE